MAEEMTTFLLRLPIEMKEAVKSIQKRSEVIAGVYRISVDDRKTGMETKSLNKAFCFRKNFLVY